MTLTTTLPQFVAELTAYDPSIGTTRSLTYAVRGFNTRPAETPANTFFDERVKQPLDIQRTMFAARATRGRATTAYGQIVLDNADGALDDLNEYGFDGQAITIRRTTTYNAAYPADYVTVLRGTMEKAEFTIDEIRVTVRDRLFEVTSALLQTTRYAGDNALPDGLEGVPEDLGGKPKPVCFGVVKNVLAPCVNTSKLVYQVNDGAVDSVDAVRDRGVPLLGDIELESESTFSAQALTAAAYDSSLDMWVAVGNVSVGSGSQFGSSPDGKAWTSRTAPVGSTNVPFLAVASNHAGQFIAVGGGDPAKSTDGTTWTSLSVVGWVGDMMSITFGNGFWVIGGINDQIAYSTDSGSTWTVITTGIGASGWQSLAFGNDIFVVVGQNGEMAISTYAAAWTRLLVRNTMVAVTFAPATELNDAMFLAVGSASSTTATELLNAMWSSDGTSWHLFNFNPSNPSRSGLSVAASGGYFAITNGSSTWLSTNGIAWRETDNLGLSTIYIGADDTGNFVLVGTSGVGQNIAASVPADDYSATADLLDDAVAPTPGTHRTCASAGYFRLGSTPDGLITADVTQGVTSADRDAAALSSAALSRLPSAPTFDSGDLAALAIADGSQFGYWTQDEGVTCANVLDAIASSLGASWYVDKSGAFRIAQLVAPSGTPDLVVTANDITKIERVTTSDVDKGIPTYQVALRWGRFYQTITTDIAGVVTDAARAQFAQEWRTVTSTDAAVLVAHPASTPLAYDTLYSVEADAQAESDRQLALREVKRDVYDVTMELNADTNAVDIGSVLEIVHPRYSLGVVGSPSGALEGGGLFRILDVRPDAKNNRVTFTVWGRARYKNLIDADGAYVLDANGAYVIAELAA